MVVRATRRVSSITFWFVDTHIHDTHLDTLKRIPAFAIAAGKKQIGMINCLRVGEDSPVGVMIAILFDMRTVLRVHSALTYGRIL